MNTIDLVHKVKKQTEFQVSFKKRKKKTIIIVFLSTLIGMSLYEMVKQIISPNITIWESHIVTIIFSTILATIATYFVLKKYEVYVQEISNKESQNRLVNIQLSKFEKILQDTYSRVELYRDLFNHDIRNIFQNFQLVFDLFSIKLNNSESKINLLEILEVFKHQIKRGTDLVFNVQKLTQIESINTILKPIEIIQTLNQAINYINKSYTNKDLDIKLFSNTNEYFAFADEYLINIFQNIIINSINYNKNSKIEIFIQVSKQIKDKISYLKIEFIDNGMGIPNEMKELLFKSPIKKENSVKGMGVGLLLVKKIIDMYNGEIFIEDRVNGDYRKGSNFILLIPETNQFENNN